MFPRVSPELFSHASPEPLCVKHAPVGQFLREVPLLLGITAVYFGAAKLGLTMAVGPQQVTAVWPPTGIALAAVLLLGYRVWPGIWLGAFLANATANEPVVAACGIAIGNTLEALIGARLLHSVVGFRTSLDRLQDVLGLVVLAAICSTTVSATIGTSSLLLMGVHPWASFGAIWWTWWVGDAVGDLIIAPLLLTWATWLQRPSWHRRGEALALVGSLVAASGLVFVGPVPSILSGPPPRFVVFPFVIWGALRFGLRGVATVTFVAAAMVVWGTIQGSGPFAIGHFGESLIMAQLFMGVIAASGLLLAAAVAERSGADEKRRESDSRLKGIIESAMDAIITIDEDERIRLFNTAAERMFRCKASDVIGRPLDRFIPVAVRAAHHGDIRRFAQTGVTSRTMGRQRTLSAVRADGEVFPMEATISQTVVAGQKLYTVILRDVTERVQAEQERNRWLAREQAARGELEAANRAKDEFLAMLGHELRNPLGAIGNAVSILNRVSGPDDPAAKPREIIARQARQLSRLVDDLLDVSRLESGKLVLQRQPVDLRITTERCLRVLQQREPRAEHAISFEGESAVVDADPTRLEQIVFNVLDNATKYTPAGGEIAVVVAREGDCGRLRVRDTGIGIAPELLPRIFDRFVQADALPERARGGLGLGLALVRRLVEEHGGTVSASSGGPAQGSEFVVTLPLARRTPAPAERGQSVTSPGIPRRIVVVEDNVDARESLRMVLETFGHQVETAEDGPSGVQLVLRSKPHIAFIDVGLPGMDGYTVAQLVRTAEGGQDTHLIAITGYGQPEDRRRALEAGFDAHLVKPVDPDALLRVLAAGSGVSRAAADAVQRAADGLTGIPGRP